jgi:type IV pilus assembly protein PilP
MRKLLLVAFLPLALVSCGDDSAKGKGEPAPRRPPPPAAGAPGAPAPAPAGLAPAAPVTKEALLAEVRKRSLSNEDFTESENNRDPFRSYLATFAVQPPVVTKQHKIVLQKFSLEELRLVAIVGGDGVTPRAMFVDPSGMGVNVVRGDHVSKSDATVVRIAPDRVFFEWDEDTGGGKAKKVERVVELHAGEVQEQ